MFFFFSNYSLSFVPPTLLICKVARKKFLICHIISEVQMLFYLYVFFLIMVRLNIFSLSVLPIYPFCSCVILLTVSSIFNQNT
jgi:hypothetical protein